MQVISTIGPENTTKTVLPFIAARGAASRDTDVDMFLMQASTYLGSHQHSNLDELHSPGLPSVEEVLNCDPVSEHLNEVIVCKPCATARGITPDDLRPGFEFGGHGDLARQAEQNDSTTTF